MGASVMPPQVVAAADGVITSVCSDGTSMAIRVDGGPVPLAYFHFDVGQSFSEGQTVTQGQVLGQLRDGTFYGSNCGYGIQASDQYHVHFVFTETTPGFLEIGGCVLDMDTQAFVCNGSTYNKLAFIPNGGGTSDPGNPDNGGTTPTGGGAHVWDGIVAAIVSLNTDTISQYLPAQNPVIAYTLIKVNLVIQALLAITMTIYSYGFSGVLLTIIVVTVITLESAMKAIEIAISLWKSFSWLIPFL
jgi:hypothetical protein